METAPVMEGQPLQVLFARAQELFAQADSGSQPAAAEAADVLLRCGDAVDRLALFSGNEDKDDLATPDLKYLAVPYLQGELAALGAATDMHERLAAVQHSQQHHTRFLHRMQQYGLLDVRVSEAFDRLEAGEAADPTTTRASKIAMFKIERDLKQRLDSLTRQRMAAARSADLDDDDEGSGAGVPVDEDAEREAWFLQLDLYALKAVQQLAASQQEAGLLAAAAAMPEAERRRAAASNAPPPEVLRQLRDAAAGLQSTRQTVRDTLLRPSHALPTRTLAQQAEIEIAQARDAAGKQRAADSCVAAKGSDDEDDDEAVHRQRAMDDWKDSHPTGWGNSKLRPTA